MLVLKEATAQVLRVVGVVIQCHLVLVDICQVQALRGTALLMIRGNLYLLSPTRLVSLLYSHAVRTSRDVPQRYVRVQRRLLVRLCMAQVRRVPALVIVSAGGNGHGARFLLYAVVVNDLVLVFLPDGRVRLHHQLRVGPASKPLVQHGRRGATIVRLVTILRICRVA